MRAVLTVIGKDHVGILSKVANQCAESNAMIMMIDISEVNCEMSELVYQMNRLGEESGLSIHVMHEDVFNSMHRI